MNLYFLVEGTHTEKKIYPSWLQHIHPDFTPVSIPSDARKNNFFIISGSGYYSMYDLIERSFDDVNENDFHYLVIVADADDVGYLSRKKEFEDYITRKNLRLKRAQIFIVIQNICIETWLLGHRKFFKRNPQSGELSRFISHYNVMDFDPEKMLEPLGNNSIGEFHFRYLSLIFQERGIGYSKKLPRDAQYGNYYDELIKRSSETNHIPSFKILSDFLNTITID